MVRKNINKLKEGRVGIRKNSARDSSEFVCISIRIRLFVGFYIILEDICFNF